MPSSPLTPGTEPYDRWFTTPVGRLVYAYEAQLLLELLDPQPGERILDAGCGSGIFTGEVLDRGATVVGLDLSLPMLGAAPPPRPNPVLRPVRRPLGLPCADASFDRVWSMTAIEFIADAARPSPNWSGSPGRAARSWSPP